MDAVFALTIVAGFRFFFFFQAEDGIRDDLVTGVQTCALPISHRARHRSRPRTQTHYGIPALVLAADHVRRAVSARERLYAPAALAPPLTKAIGSASFNCISYNTGSNPGECMPRVVQAKRPPRSPRSSCLLA